MRKSYEKALLLVGILYKEFIPDNGHSHENGESKWKSFAMNTRSNTGRPSASVRIFGKIFSKTEQALIYI